MWQLLLNCFLLLWFGSCGIVWELVHWICTIAIVTNDLRAAPE